MVNNDSDSSESDDPRFRAVAIEASDWKDYTSRSQKPKNSSKMVENMLKRCLESRIIFQKDIWPPRLSGEDTLSHEHKLFSWCTPKRSSIIDLKARTKRLKEEWIKNRHDTSAKKAYKRVKRDREKEELRIIKRNKQKQILSNHKEDLAVVLKKEKADSEQALKEKQLWFQSWYCEYHRRTKKKKKIQKSAKKLGKPLNTLFCVGFPIDYTKTQVEQLFSSHNVQRLSYNRKEGKPPIAFIRFLSVDAATKCLSQLQGYSLGSTTVRLAFAKKELPFQS